ncbi:MAG: hypothetical protein IPL45_00130 [Actinomycetales bacterium]|nr:hypothetical protein [Actinomycetales bacterium]
MAPATQYAYAVFTRDAVPNYATPATATVSVITPCSVSTIEANTHITSDTTWRTCTVHVVQGLVVDPGVTLTVQAGAVVKAIDSSSTLTVLGTLVAQGTAAAPGGIHLDRR